MLVADTDASKLWPPELPEAVPPAEALDERQHADDGEAHDGEVVALDAFDDGAAEALDAVGAGLVHRLAGSYVRLARAAVERAEADAHALQPALHAPVHGHRDAGAHLVVAAGKAHQHLDRLLAVL